MSGCPGMKMFSFDAKIDAEGVPGAAQPSRLRQWPVQLHLVSPAAPYFRGADVLLAADCTAFAMGSFHSDWLKGKSLAIACPKLDSEQDAYVGKLKALMEEADINTLTVLIMQVPCCRGLAAHAARALKESARKVPVRVAVVSLQGEILQDEWLEG
jgi:hypothetical protein